ncbi:MAG: hypothetical protein IKQ35_05400 [Bacilli bacterium]|nr:hypothetical protein [Bacilli bacterium]
MNKKRMIGIIVVGIVIIAVGIVLFINNKKEDNSKNTDNKKTENKVVEKEVEKQTIFLDTDFICGLNNDESCKLFFYNDNGDRVTITDQSAGAGMATYNNLVYYFHKDGYIHVYDASTGSDKKIDIKYGTNNFSIQVNSKYLILLDYEETKNEIKLYDRETLKEIKIDICYQYQGKLIGEDLIYRTCDEKIGVYNIKDSKNTVIFDKEVLFLDNLLIDEDRVLINYRGEEGVLIYDTKDNKVETIDINKSYPSFNIVAFKDNIIVYTDSENFYRYDISTKGVDKFHIDYDFYNSGYKDNKLIYIYNNVIKEYDLINKEDKQLYVVDKKIVNVKTDEKQGIEFETHIYNNNLVITKRVDQGSKTDCTGGECHGLTKEKFEYYTYNYSKNVFKKLDVVDYREAEE